MSSLNWISVTPQSPIHIGESKPDFSFLPTKEVIPGSILRGALAEYLIMQGRESEIKEFIANMRFGFLYPSESPALLPLPLPTSTLECKNHQGFKSKESHGIFDALLASVAYEELEKFSEFPVPLTFKCKEKECGSRMDKVSGFYAKEGGKYTKVEVKRTSQTKVAISRRRKASESEMLYSITAIRPKNVSFVGKVVGDRDKFEVLLDALNEVGIGALTTRGYGMVKANGEDIIIEEIDDLKERVKSFNRRLGEVWRDIASIALNKDKIPKEPTGTYFSVDILSPAILIDYNGLRTLKLQLNLDGTRIYRVLFSAYPIFIGGWSTAWGLPKETTYGAGTGSTYVFKVAEEDEELYQELEGIELEGIGKMRDEGYGDVLICHPFHKEVTPV